MPAICGAKTTSGDNKQIDLPTFGTAFLSKKYAEILPRALINKTKTEYAKAGEENNLSQNGKNDHGCHKGSP